MKVEELVYGFKGNETYLTLYFNKVAIEDVRTLQPRAGIYMIYDKQDELMYIGETTSLTRRMSHHLSPNWGKKEINKETVGHILYAYLGEDNHERRIIEGLLVNKYRPALNCDDAKVSEAQGKVSPEVVRDVRYYTTHTNIKSIVIAKAFNVDSEFVVNVRNNGIFNHIVVPKGYQPSKIITQEFIEANTTTTRREISRTVFNEIRELLESGSMKQIEIARQYNFASAVITSIKKLQAKKYRKWEEQRLNKVGV